MELVEKSEVVKGVVEMITGSDSNKREFDGYEDGNANNDGVHLCVQM